MDKPVPRKVYYDKAIYDEGGNFVKYEVEAHLLIREGVLEGCTLPTISVVDPSTGKTYQSSLDFYHETEEDAWEAIQTELSHEILDKESEIEALQRELQALKDYQNTL